MKEFCLLQTYYPSNTNHGPVLLASYTWEHEADYWLSMTDDMCIQKVAPSPALTAHTRSSSVKFVAPSVWTLWRSGTAV